MTRPDNPGARELAWRAGENRTLWDYYAFALGQNRFHQVMDENYWRTLTTVFLKDANFVETARLMKETSALTRASTSRRKESTRIRGRRGPEPVAHSRRRRDATAIVVLVVAGIFPCRRCWRLVALGPFFACLPSALAVLIKFAAMGWLGIPLGVATSMFAAMTLGIG